MKIEELVGLTPVSIDGNVGDREIEIAFSDGSVALFYHMQDCCEDVWVEDINGSWDDLIGSPLLVAEERSNDEYIDQAEEMDVDTWTFYTFRTVKGSVDVRWHGTSNGYYSTSVSLVLKR